jgi:hypothetical protein
MKKETKAWDFNFLKIHTNNLPDPYGFNANIIEVKNIIKQDKRIT